MAVSIDTVYQRVLALANKEQRGYITPQEFNLFANQAQMDIFEQYFYDINQFGRIPGNSTEYSDMLTLLNEKIAIFKTRATLDYDVNISPPAFVQPQDLYKLGTILYSGSSPIIVPQVNYNEFVDILNSPLLKPSKTSPIFYEENLSYVLSPSTIITSIEATYVKKPSTVNWGYNVVGEHALYDNTPGVSVDFELHPSEESVLVVKILAMAGITLKDASIYQIASTEDNKNTQQEKQ